MQEEVKQLKKENRTLRYQKLMLDLEKEEEKIWKEIHSVPKSSLDWALVEWVLNPEWVKKNPGVDLGSVVYFGMSKAFLDMSNIQTSKCPKCPSCL